MKLFLVFAFVAFVASVPVNEAPEKLSVEAPATPATEAPTPAVAETEVKAVEAAAPAAVEAEKPAAVEAEKPAAVETETPAAVEAEKPAAVEAEKPAAVEAEATAVEAVDSAKQVEDTVKMAMNLVQVFMSKMPEEEQKSIHEIIEMGEKLVSQTTEKVQEVQAKLESTNLLQSDPSNMGIRADGSIDPEAAAKTLDSLISVFVGPEAISTEEKDTMHTVINALAGLFNPFVTAANNGGPMPSIDFTQVETLFNAIVPESERKNLPFDIKTLEMLSRVFSRPAAGNRDAQFGFQDLLSIFTETDDQASFNADALGELANKFINEGIAGLNELAEKRD